MQAASLAQQQAGLLQAALHLCGSASEAGAASAEEASSRVDGARGAVHSCQRELAQAVQRLEEATAAAADRGDTSGLQHLATALAALEEEVRLLNEQQRRHAQLEAQLAAERAAVERLTAASSAAAAELASCQQAQRQAAADLQLAESASSAQALQASLEAEERQLAAAVAAREQAVASAVAAAEQTASLLPDLLSEQRRAQAALQAAQNAVGASGLRQLATFQAQMQQQHARLQQLQHQEQSLQAEAGTLAARLVGACGGSSSSSAGAGSRACRPLHQCFSFRDPQRCQQFATVLQVLAGSKLGVLVADSLEAAGQALAAGGGSRIWPLDSIVAADYTAQQRRAAQQFGAGRRRKAVGNLRTD